MNKFFVLFLFLISCTYAQNKAPKLVADRISHDFGKVVEGEKLMYDFEIKNSGDADLIIKTVRSSCGCTVAQPEKMSLSPGESTIIHVEFDTNDHEGEQQKIVYVYTNDPNNSEFRFTINASVLTPDSKDAVSMKFGTMKLSKTKHDFGSVQEGKVYIMDVTISNIGDGNLEIKNITTTCGCTVALVTDKIIKPGDKTTLKIELDTTGREGKFVRAVNINTNDRVQPLQTVTLFANIKVKN